MHQMSLTYIAISSNGEHWIGNSQITIPILHQPIYIDWFTVSIPVILTFHGRLNFNTFINAYHNFQALIFVLNFLWCCYHLCLSNLLLISCFSILLKIEHFLLLGHPENSEVFQNKACLHLIILLLIVSSDFEWTRYVNFVFSAYVA